MLPRWLSGKKIYLQFRRHRRCGFNPWVGKIPWRRKWQPTPVFLPGKSQGQRSLAGQSPWGPKESDTTEHYTMTVMILNTRDPRISQHLTTNNAQRVIRQDPGHNAGDTLCSQVLTLSFWDHGDVKILPKEGLMMGKVGTQEVLGSGYSLTYRDI